MKTLQLDVYMQDGHHIDAEHAHLTIERVDIDGDGFAEQRCYLDIKYTPAEGFTFQSELKPELKELVCEAIAEGLTTHNVTRLDHLFQYETIIGAPDYDLSM